MNDTPTMTYASKGFSLVELMVAMVLGLMLLAGVISMFIANRQVYRTNENISRLQEAARIVNELMGREIRAAGGNQCGARPPLPPTSFSPPPWWSQWSNPPADFGIKGYDNNATISAVGFHSGSGTPNAGDRAPKSAVQYDSHALLIRTATLHDSGSSAAVLSCTLGASTPPTVSTSPQAGAINAPLDASFWYVGYNGRTRSDGSASTSLYRLNMSGNKEEIMEGVTGMEISYLLRNSGALATDYVGASSVTDWDKVVAVRVKLWLKTAENISTSGTQPITRIVSFTTSIRNREEVQ